MLVTMREIVDAAREGRYCVPAPNYNDVTQLYAAADAAVQARAPLILDIGRMFATEDRALFQELACASRSVAERTVLPDSAERIAELSNHTQPLHTPRPVAKFCRSCPLVHDPEFLQVAVVTAS